MSLYPNDTLQPGDRINVVYMHSSVNCDSWRTDTVEVARIEGEIIHGTDGYRYHQSTVTSKCDPEQ